MSGSLQGVSPDTTNEQPVAEGTEIKVNPLARFAQDDPRYNLEQPLPIQPEAPADQGIFSGVDNDETRRKKLNAAQAGVLGDSVTAPLSHQELEEEAAAERSSNLLLTDLLNDTSSNLDDVITAMNYNFDDFNAECFEPMEQVTLDTFDIIQQDLIDSAGQIEAQAAELQRLKDQLEQEQDPTVREELEQQIAQQQLALDKVTQDYLGHNDAYQNLNTKYQTAKDERDAAQQRMDALKGELAEANKNGATQEEINAIKERINAERENLNAIRVQIDALKEEAQAMNSERTASREERANTLSQEAQPVNLTQTTTPPAELNLNTPPSYAEQQERMDLAEAKIAGIAAGGTVSMETIEEMRALIGHAAVDKMLQEKELKQETGIFAEIGLGGLDNNPLAQAANTYAGMQFVFPEIANAVKPIATFQPNQNIAEFGLGGGYRSFVDEPDGAFQASNDPKAVEPSYVYQSPVVIALAGLFGSGTSAPQQQPGPQPTPAELQLATLRQQQLLAELAALNTPKPTTAG